MATARETFVLADPKTYTPVVILAGETIPDWALDKVTHPDILGGDPEPVTIDDHAPPTAPVTGDSEEDELQGSEDDETADSEEDDEIDESQNFTVEDEGDTPDETWLKAEIADYLIERGVSVSGSETKDELLAKVEQGD